MSLTLRFPAVARLGVSATKGRFISVTSSRHGAIVPYKLSDIGEGIREVTVKEWFVKPGDKVAQFDNICEVQSDKASVTITSRYDGLIKSIHYKIDEIALVGDALVDIELNDDKTEENPSQEVEQISAPEAVSDRVTEALAETPIKPDNVSNRTPKCILTTPAVRKMAKENNVNLADVKATGKDGRVLKEDMLLHLGKLPGKKETAEALGPSKKYMKHMWKTMTQSLDIPHFVYSDELDMSKLVLLRAEVRDDFKCRNISLSYMPFFIKAISRALLQFPELNAWVNEETQSAKIIEQHNISIALDTPEGLVVPNIKNVQDLDITGIAKELNRLQTLGSKSSIPLTDLTGGTISLSNIGVVGGTYTKPVILPPQVVIGAIGKIQKLPRFDNSGNVIAANILTVSWAADHRVIEGVTMAKFSNLWKHYLENPYHLLLGI